MTIQQLVDRERTTLQRLHLLAGAAMVLAATCTVVGLAALILGGARWLTLPRGAPIAVWVVVVSVDIAAMSFTRRLLRRQTSVGTITEELEREQSLRAGSVRGIMEVADTGSLGRHAAAHLSARLGRAHATLLPAARGSARRRLLQLGVVAIAAAVLLGALAPTFGDGLRAVMRPVDAWRGTLLPAIRFEDLPTAVVRGEALRLRIAAAGRHAIVLKERATGEGWHSERLTVGATGIATFEVGPISGDLHLVATDGRSSTDTMVVLVADRPFLGGVTMRAVYPAYLERPADGLAIGEPARVPAGTVIEISGRASTALHDVRLMSERDTVLLAPSGHTFRGRVQPRVSGSWRWKATGAAGAVTDVPPPIQIEVIPDSLPRAEIITPVHDTLVSPNDRVVLRLSAVDDHGIASVEVASWRSTDPERERGAAGRRDGNGKESSRVSDRVASFPGPVWGTTVELDVAQHGLAAGDILHVKLVAVDNSPWSQRGESRELLVRIATAEQQRELARNTGDSAVAEAQAVVAAQKALERRTTEAQQDRGAKSSNDGKANSSNSMNFEAAQKAKALAQQQRALADQVKQLAQAAKALEDQLRRAGALDSGLARELQEAQALLRDALTPELMRQMQKLEGAARQLSKDDAQQSLKDLRAQQQRLREQLEKSAEMLRRAAMEGSMQTLTDEAKDLARQQRALADSAKLAESEAKGGAEQSGEKSAGLRPENAKQLADRSEHLASEMKRLSTRLDNARAATGAAKTDEARQHAEASEEKLRTPSPGKAEAAAREAASQMDQSASAMKAARDGQVQEWKKELTSALDQSIQEMLQMSREENSLHQQVTSGESKSEETRGQQSAIKQGLDAAAQRLQREAQKSSLLSSRSQRAVSDAQQKVDQATQSTADPKNAPQSANAMSDAANALNKAAASLARDRERANTASSATGFAEMIQQMQEMAGKQNSINSQAQGIMPMPGGSMSTAAQAQARTLARQQRQVADKLDELGDGAGGDKAAKLAQEARQLADALDGSRIDASTLARQQQLFKKLLDAGRSLEKDDREQSDRREARAGNDLNQFKPDATSATGRNATRFREPTWDELRALSADERRIILEYFKKLNGHGG